MELTATVDGSKDTSPDTAQSEEDHYSAVINCTMEDIGPISELIPIQMPK